MSPHRKASLCAMILGAVCGVGCSSGGNGSSSSSSSGSSNGSSGSSSGDCTLPATISTNMTLTTSCPVWHVTASGTTVAGSGNPVLTVDPGVTVAFDKGGFLSIGTSAPGGIVAAGTPDAGITFTSGAANPAAGDWSALALGDQTLSTSILAYADFEFGSGVGSGGNTSSNDGYTYSEPAGALIVYGGTNGLSLVLHDLAFSHNAGNGLVYDNFNAGFAAGSGNLKVDDVAAGFEPFVISANQAWTLPTTISGPTATAVDLICGDGCPPGTGGEALVAADEPNMAPNTWPAIPLPYLVDGKTVGMGGGVQIEGAGNSTATLTIAAPNTLEFKSGGVINVDPNGSAQAAFVATANQAQPIIFTSSVNPSAPSSGSWGGIQFTAPNSGGHNLALSKLQGVTIRGAGDSTLSHGSVSQVVIDILSGSSSDGPVIAGCTIEDYPTSACGIVYNAQWTTPPTPPGSYDAPTNTFPGAPQCTVDSSP